jgi:glycosyltransferase involved in cell wall biosynthesis
MSDSVSLYKIDMISIIIPVYNGAKVLKRSVGSVYRQTYENIELILINDGSTDESLQVLEKLAGKAPENVHVVILDQKNHGICIARNHGIDHAHGKYIMFMDQDDRMHPDCIERLVCASKPEPMDTACQCRDIKEDRTASTNETIGDSAYANAEDKQDIRYADMVIGGFDLKDVTTGKIKECWTLDPDHYFDMFRITAPWGRLFRKSIIDKYNLRFMVTKISEDLYFNYVYLSYCRNVMVLPYRGYVWYVSPASESHANMSRYSEDRDVLKVLDKMLADMDHPSEGACRIFRSAADIHMNKSDDISSNKDYIGSVKREYIDYAVIKHVVWYLFFTARSLDADALKINYNRCINWLLANAANVYDNPLIRKVNEPAGENPKIKLIIKFSVLLIRMKVFEKLLQVYRVL